MRKDSYICATCTKSQEIDSIHDMRLGEHGEAQVCFACYEIEQLRDDALLTIANIGRIGTPHFRPQKKLVVSQRQFDYLVGICEHNADELLIDRGDN